MDQARKTGRARPKLAAPSTKKVGPSTAPRREVRVNRRALTVVTLATALAVPGLLGLKAFQDRSGRSALLVEARKQRDEAKRPDLALGYFNRYLELVPDDLDALDQRAALLAGAARDPGSVDAAIRAHVLSLGKGAGDGRGRGPARKRLAGLYLRSEQFRAAEQAIRDHLRLEPADVEGRRLLARSLEGVGRLGDAKALEAAAAEYEAVEALEPGDVASGERLAALYLDKFGDKAKAIRVLDALLEHNPGSSKARLARARVFASIGDARAASVEVDEAIRIDPADVDTRLAAAEAASRRGEPAAAKAHLAAIDPPRPDDLRVKVIRGQIELDERKTDQALRDWRDGLALTDGTDAELTWRLAHVLIQLGRVREATPLVSQYRRLVGGDEVPPAVRYLVGLAMLKSGRTAEAIAELEAIRYKPSWGLDGPFHLALGQAHEASADLVKAADAYTRATASPAAGAAPWLALARVQAVDRPTERAATLERGIAVVGPDERLLAELARDLWRAQAALPAAGRDWSRLDQVLDQGEKATPASVDLALVRADRAASLGRPEDGLVVLEAASARFPASGALRLALAEALDKLGRVDEAVARLDEAVASSGEQAGFRIARARFALAKGQPKAAEAALVEGLERVPAEQRPSLARALGEFHLTRGDRPAARRAYLEWAALLPESFEPHLTLLGLAIEAGDDRSIDLAVESLKAIGGPSSPYWKIARAESLLRDRPGSATPAALLEEAARLVAEVQASTPGQPAGFLLEARLMEHRGRLDGAIRSYQKAIDLKAGMLAVKPLAALLHGLGMADELATLRARVGGFPPEVEARLVAPAPRPGAIGDADELARRLIEGDPAALDVRAWKSRALHGPEKSREAEEELRRQVARRPEAPEPWVRLLMSRVVRKDRAGALETIGRMKAAVKVDHPDRLLANCGRAAGLRDLADRAFLDALRASPDDRATLRSAIDHYEEMGRPEQAEPLLRRLRKANPALDWARRRLALNLAARPGNRPSWPEALELAGGGSYAPDSLDDRLTRAVVLSLGPEARRGEGIAILERLAAEVPDSFKVQEALARALLGSGDRARAREHATRAIRAVDATPDSIRLVGVLDLDAGDLDAASRQVARLEAMGLDDPATVELKARVLKGRGQAGEAVAALEKALDAANGSADPVEFGRGLVRLLAGLGEPEAAERVARKVAGLGPLGPVVLAEWLGSRGRFEEASPLYDDASRDRQAGREAARSALALASTTREARWAGLADRLLDRAIGAGPADDDLAYARASLRHLQGRVEEAVAIYDELAARSPSTLPYLNNCAWLLSEDLGRPLEGLRRIEALTAKAGDQPHSLDTRGVILLRLGQAPRAIADLEVAAAAVPSGPICFHLARAYLAAGRRDDAAKALARAKAAGLKPEGLQPSERAEFARVMTALK